jgi:hypothetical protein
MQLPQAPLPQTVETMHWAKGPVPLVQRLQVFGARCPVTWASAAKRFSRLFQSIFLGLPSLSRLSVIVVCRCVAGLR